MSSRFFRLPSDVETDCAEALPPRVPSLEPHKPSAPGTLRSRDCAHESVNTKLDEVDIASMDSGFASGLSMNRDSGLSMNRDSGLEITEQLEHLHISEEVFSDKPSQTGNRDSGFDAGLDHVDGGYISTELKSIPSCGDCTTENENISLHSLFEQDEEGDNHLHMAIIHRNMRMADALIKLCPSQELLNLENDFRQTALHLGVLTDQALLVRKLVLFGAKLEARDRNGNTALHLACMHGFEACIEMLTTPLSAQEKTQTPHKVSPLIVPQDLSIKNYEGEPCLHVCLSAPLVNRFRIVSYLIKHCGANINTMEGKSGKTLLHEAASCNDAQLAEFLLQQLNVQVDSRTYGGHTPLKLAKSGGYEDIACKLLICGADPAALVDIYSDSDDDSMDSG